MRASSISAVLVLYLVQMASAASTTRAAKGALLNTARCSEKVTDAVSSQWVNTECATLTCGETGACGMPDWNDCKALADKVTSELSKSSIPLKTYGIPYFNNPKTITAWGFGKCILEFGVKGSVEKPEWIVADMDIALKWVTQMADLQLAQPPLCPGFNAIRCKTEDTIERVTLGMYYYPGRLTHVHYL